MTAPPVVVRVTARDIEEGLCARADRCPVARAARRAFGCEVVAGSDFIHRVQPWKAWCYRTPPEAAEAIRRFDAGEPIEPFDFVLAEPEVFGDG